MCLIEVFLDELFRSGAIQVDQKLLDSGIAAKKNDNEARKRSKHMYHRYQGIERMGVSSDTIKTNQVNSTPLFSWAISLQGQ